MKRARTSVTAGLVLGALCGGCAVRPASVPKVDVPRDWGPYGLPEAAAPTPEWFRGFGSPELDELISAAGRSNPELQAADARVLQADARARAAGAALLPEVSAGANGTFYAGHSSHGSVSETDYAALLSASYEIDFWGRNRAGRMSARALRDASDADRAVVALSITAAVADTYFQVIALRERVEIANQSLRNADQFLAVVEARRAVQLSNPMEVAEQRAVVAAARIHVRELEQQEADEEAALCILVGKTPGSVSVAGQRLSELTAPRVSPGLPAELLGRRPDVAFAESNLQAAHADLIQARAAFFPSITLTGSGGLQNPAVAAAVQTLTGLGPSLNVGADVVQSIFNGGRLRAARDEARGKEEEMLARYQAAVLAALWDVQKTLSVIEHLDRQESAQKQNVAESERALAGARARYRAGSGDLLAVIETERALLSAQEQLRHYELARLQAVVGLCKALGGGWVQES